MEHVPFQLVDFYLRSGFGWQAGTQYSRVQATLSLNDSELHRRAIAPHVMIDWAVTFTTSHMLCSKASASPLVYYYQQLRLATCNPEAARAVLFPGAAGVGTRFLETKDPAADSRI